LPSNDPNPRSLNVVVSRAKTGLIFVAHQIVGTWGIAFFAAFALFSLLDVIPHFAEWKRSMRFVHWVLTENPFYPVQLLTALYVGWRLGRRFQHKSMLWVWVLPLAVLCFALIAFNPEWTSVLARPSTVGSRLSHYFGWGCQPRAHCLDQLVITMPFYSSVAYSLGALLARNALKKPRQIPSVS
jgi:hypothetical protein